MKRDSTTHKQGEWLALDDAEAQALVARGDAYSPSELADRTKRIAAAVERTRQLEELHLLDGAANTSRAERVAMLRQKLDDVHRLSNQQKGMARYNGPDGRLQHRANLLNGFSKRTDPRDA